MDGQCRWCLDGGAVNDEAVLDVTLQCALVSLVHATRIDELAVGNDVVAPTELEAVASLLDTADKTSRDRFSASDKVESTELQGGGGYTTQNQQKTSPSERQQYVEGQIP